MLIFQIFLDISLSLLLHLFFLFFLFKSFSFKVILDHQVNLVFKYHIFIFALFFLITTVLLIIFITL